MEEVKSILTEDQLAELNPEGIEINTVIDDTTSQDLFNEDNIIELSEGDAENTDAVDEAVEVEGE